MTAKPHWLATMTKKLPEGVTNKPEDDKKLMMHRYGYTSTGRPLLESNIRRALLVDGPSYMYLSELLTPDYDPEEVSIALDAFEEGGERQLAEFLLGMKHESFDMLETLEWTPDWENYWKNYHLCLSRKCRDALGIRPSEQARLDMIARDAERSIRNWDDDRGLRFGMPPPPTRPYSWLPAYGYAITGTGTPRPLGRRMLRKTLFNAVKKYIQPSTR